MARMVPSVCSADTLSGAERRVFESLRDLLDDAFTVFHSYELYGRNMENKLVDGEIDFLVYSRRHGFLILEVKGGIIGHDGTSGQWLQNGRPMKQSPYGQARKNKYFFRDFLARNLGDIRQIRFAHAVCFPDVHTDIETLPADADRLITITARELPYLSEKLHSIFDHTSVPEVSQLSSGEMTRIENLLMPKFEYGASLADTIANSERQLFRLTENQCEMLNFIGDRRRALIKGCAGSGKTALAIKKACALADRGMNVVLLCFNKPLSKKLEAFVEDRGDKILAANYHSFCLRKLREAGVELAPNVDGFWDTHLPEIFDEHIRQTKLKFDAIIVDEGQDFKWQYWATIESMLRDDSYFYVFYDPLQNIYATEMDIPSISEDYELTVNCRNTKTIAERMNLLYPSAMTVRPDAPDGPSIREIHCSGGDDQRRVLKKILHELVNDQKVPASSIVILGGHSFAHSSLMNCNILGNFVVTDGEADAKNSIGYYSYMRFKGCEADVAILIDVDESDERWSNQGLYVAISRARHAVYMLHRSGSAASANS